MKKRNMSLPFIVLDGDPLENYYQLGLKDRQIHHKRTTQKKDSTSREKINFLFYAGLKIPSYAILKRHPSFAKVARAYSEGLNVRTTEFASLILGAEWASTGRMWPFFSFRPHFFGVSCFHWRGEDICMTGSIPFLRGDDLNGCERLVLYKLKKSPKVFSCNTAGGPWPSFFSMNEKGMMLSIFQGGAGKLNLKGMPVFEIINQLLFSNMAENTALSFLKKTNSIGSWKIHLGYPSGRVLTAEMNGEKKIFKKFDLKKKNTLFLGNTPNGFFFNQNASISKNADNLKLFDFKEKVTLTKPHPQKGLDVRKFSSFSCLFDPQGSCLAEQGQNPNYLEGNYESLNSIWTKPVFTLKKRKWNQTELYYRKGINSFLLSQACFAKKDWHPAYHHIQMAIAVLKKSPEENICRFYFLLYEFINNHSKKTHLRLLAEFEKLPEDLPEMLRRHCLLFIWRIKYILKIETPKDRDNIDKTILAIESKIPRILLPLFVAKSLLPAESFLNIFYTHQLISSKGD